MTTSSTVYGRYGSWAHQSNPEESAADGFRKVLESSLEIHADYPACKASLAGKQPRPSPYRTPVDMPGLQGRYSRNLDWEGAVVQSCVHCHQIGDAERRVLRERREPIPVNLIYPFPAPGTIGLELALNRKARVKAVTAGSVAARAGFREGDDLLTLDGQPLLSIADVSWALHHAPDSGSIEAKHVGRYGEHAAAMKAGFQKDDVLVEAAGGSSRLSESELIGQLLRGNQPGDSIQTKVLRGDESIQLTAPYDVSQSGVALPLPAALQNTPGSRMPTAILDCAGRVRASTALSLHSANLHFPGGASYPPSLGASARRAGSPQFHVLFNVGLV